MTGVTALTVRARDQAAATTPDAQWRSAVDAWEAGDYRASLGTLRTLMKSPASGEYLERVALLTGELFVTTEITTDGSGAAVSADGRFVSVESGPANAPITRLYRLTAGRAEQIAELPGGDGVFDRNGPRFAWIRPPKNAEWNAAQQAYSQASTNQERQAAMAPINWLLAKSGDLVVRDLSTGTERVGATPGLLKSQVTWGATGRLLFIGSSESDLTRSDVYRVSETGAPERVTTESGFKTLMSVDPSGKALVYQATMTPTFRSPAPAPADPSAAGGRGAGGGRGGGGRGGGGGGGGGRGGPATYGIVDLAANTTRALTANSLTMSADGSTLAWTTRTGDTTTLSVSPVLSSEATTVRTGRERLEAPALSPDGQQVAYQLMTHTDWEIYLSDRSGAHRRFTRDIQHDVLPRFVSSSSLIAMMGEARHRRSQLYDVATGSRTRIFANNTVRTISPEYAWIASADGRTLIVEADRDGDTVSTEHGIYAVDLTRKVTVADVLARIERQLAGESDLWTRMTQAFRPVEALARQVVSRARINRVYEYQKALFDFDSKHISQPGNAKAIDYLERTYRSFGYQPEVQWFSPNNALGGKTANVLARLRGTEDPDLIYVVSSHFDSVAGGPGADDDTSGTAALLEASRLLAATPLPTTVVFASFTGEEAGLLGSREFVRQAAAQGWKVVGALNNDMIGWGGESARMDNTIRYSNAGIRDIQHGASFLFTDLILYDAKYYRSTDAAAFYEAWGDIVGGIGSYPVLSNPNYHQPTDFLETINHRQVMETAKVTAATLVYLASSPSRVNGLKAARSAAGIELSWSPSPESSVRNYIVAYGPATDPLRTRMTVTTPGARLPSAPAGTHVAVKAVNARGLEGWDWARAVVQ